MKVRKPTSKRTTTRMREGIKKKAAAQRRKDRKSSKKDPTWRSKKKDPGIPSSFPYKDKILSQIENKRLQDQLEKERLKQEKIVAGNEQNQNNDDEQSQIGEDEEIEDEGSNPLAALLASAQQAAKEFNGDDGEDEDEDIMEKEIENELDIVDHEIEYSDDESIIPNDMDKSRKAYDKIFKAVVEASDVILYVLDARDPETTRSRKVEEAVLSDPNKRLIFILNKIDLIPDNILQLWLTYFKSQFPTIPIKAASGNSAARSNTTTSFNKNFSQAVTSKNLLQSLKTYANKSNLKRSIVVGVIGYPNVGKSSIINSLTSRFNRSSKACPVGNQAGVTTSLREVKIDNKLKILDSPGIIFPNTPVGVKNNSKLNQFKKEQEYKLVLLNALSNKFIKDPTNAIQLLIKRIINLENSDPFENFEKYYELPPIPNINLKNYTKQILVHVARKRGRLGKGGVPNLDSAALSILNDWKDGKIICWTLPPKNVKEFKNIRNNKELPKTDQVTIVKQWSKEFDLDELFRSTGIDNVEQDQVMA
ncbi:RNA-binding GTPase NUG1 [Ascoidea rubescens DSM 1968]|uniref:p-loop containing nucleoside triphosphate hydrolase protein n=1 Tax=Ascoidea rubescens DSM 1968 TaxID=1344418 RepID=A0A1D2VIV9_9ASCO|nr:P-loop containing nucleoside triphosphate hydrolase protein [Ascoidea rubescens DSM 1968]ODV61559.1 P-loop containing nucleoside triphosphate hydrolase protein [Ascoidea rubescens DSM 1968]